MYLTKFGYKFIKNKYGIIKYASNYDKNVYTSKVHKNKYHVLFYL